MKLITRYNLASKSEGELRGLYRMAFNALVQSTPESAQRRNALASLENISREINQRYLYQFKIDVCLRNHRWEFQNHKGATDEAEITL